MSVSSVSATDVEVFKRLTNPTVVDVQNESRTRRAAAQMRQAMERAAALREEDEQEAAQAPASEPPQPASPQAGSESVPSPGEERRQSALQRAQAAAQAQDAALRRAEETRALQADVLSAAAQAKSEVEVPPRPSPVARDSPVPESDEEEDDVEPPRRFARRQSGEPERLEKQGYLIELTNLKQKGAQLSRDFTMRDSLTELEFEVQKQNNNITTRNTVNFMRDTLRIVINGIEIGNNRFGPFLSIDGWAESVTQDMRKYEHALERIYKRYWRKTQMSPVMELGWLLIGSMVAWHFKSKFFGPPAGSTRHQESAAPAQAARASPPPRAPGRAAAGSTRPARPVLRPPSSLFG